MSSRRTYTSPSPMARVGRNKTLSQEGADQFARSEHPVKFSNELVDSLQKNTFVRHTRPGID